MSNIIPFAADEAVSRENFNSRIAALNIELNTYGIKIIAHTKTGTVHALTGLNGAVGTLSCIASMTASYVAGDTFTVEGIPYAIVTSNGVPLDDNAFIAGSVIQLIIDTVGAKVNFVSGIGGLVYTNKNVTCSTTAPSVFLGEHIQHQTY